MSIIRISEEAYDEFITFLDGHCLENYDLRVTYMGKNCQGVTFNINCEEQQPGDIIEQINDIKFFIPEELIDEYEGFIILSNSENNGQGLEFKPMKVPKSNCTVCPGC